MTEAINEKTRHIDTLDAYGIVQLMNDEDLLVARAVQKVLPEIARAAEVITEKLRGGGRLLYFGAGTSGRLGVLDAAECPPTFGVGEELVQGFIAGGDAALRCSVEGAEDDEALGARDADAANITKGDAVVGIAASGATPYVLAVLRRAKELGAATIGLCNVEKPALAAFADIVIAPIVGPEALCGSTRLKSGTSQKMALNMLSTAAMIKLGKTHGNLMAHMSPSNQKLRGRAVRIVAQAAGVDEMCARKALEDSGWVISSALTAAGAKRACAPPAQTDAQSLKIARPAGT